MAILNMTQHVATIEQREAGVVEPDNKQEIQELLTFDELPQTHEVRRVALHLATIACDEGFKSVMIGGAPFLMPMLAEELDVRGIDALFAFSVRESTEYTAEDGSIQKQNVFRHKGFVEA